MFRLRRLSVAAFVGVVVAFGASAAGSSPAFHEVSFECRVKSSNDGCEKTVECPAGTTVQSARAACNLEHGRVKDEQLASVEPGYVEVVVPSDHAEEGKCWLGRAQVESGRATLADIVGLTGVSLGCQEHDKNGGDCVVRGSLYCE